MAKKTFEQSMQELEKIVEDLESGDLPLEQAIKKFEDGIRLSEMCTKILDETEKKITLLIKSADGNIVEKPFVSAGEQIPSSENEIEVNKEH